jgi:transposase
MSDAAGPPAPEPPAESTAALPDDLVILRQMVCELLEALRQTRRENEQLQHRLDLLLRRLYGPRTERFDPDQLLLIPDAFEPAAPETADGVPPVSAPGEAPANRARPHGRRPLPKDLPREPRVYELTGAERRCPECGEGRIKIGEEHSEQLDYRPASLFVIEHIRWTYACPDCEGQVVTAGKPAQPIDKGLPGPGLVAHVITEKYADHIPLHRQERRLARQGVELSRSTLCDWMAGAAGILRPLYELMKALILACDVIHTDDTPVKVRDTRRKLRVTARLWGYFGDHLSPFDVFDFTLSHRRDGPSRFLAGFRGFLQADAFSGYDGIYAGGDVVEVGCNAHARRKFIEAQTSDPARAAAALAHYRALYAIEKEIKAEITELSPDADEATRAAIRLRVRQEKAVPIWEAFGKWLEAERPDVLPKSPLAGALGYMQNNEEALQRYTSSGSLSIDNNVAEQHMKTIATGRKNWLFTGSAAGGQTMATLFSVVSSCQRHGHDPFVYLRDVLTRLPELPKERLGELLPDRWKPAETAESSSRVAEKDR